MAKTKVSEFDAVASNNTDINSVNVAEGCPPSGINNAIREMASLLKKQEVGTDAMTSPDINGGTIDGATIGGSSGVTIGVSDGTVSAPSIKFTSDTNTGIYRGGTDILKFVTAGTDAITIDASQGVTLAGNLDVSSGTIKLDGNYPTGTDNVALGDGALSSGSLSGSSNTAIGDDALRDNTTGVTNTGIGATALRGNTTGIQNTGLGRGALQINSTGNSNTAVGYNSLLSNTTAGYNTAVGHTASYSNTTGASNTSVGAESLYANTTGNNNVSVGLNTMRQNSTGSSNTALGRSALQNNTTASNNTAVGYQAGYSNTTGTPYTFIGYQAGYGQTAGTGGGTALGYRALYASGGPVGNTAIGHESMYSTTNSGDNNTALGHQSLYSNTTASQNTAVGYQALYANTTGTDNTVMGKGAGDSITTGSGHVLIGEATGTSITTNNHNTFVGRNVGTSTTGGQNTFVGCSNGSTGSTGHYITTGTKNTIIGAYSGNQGGLDIRTSSNNIVLSDGDGNPRLTINSEGRVAVGETAGTYSGKFTVNSAINNNGACVLNANASDFSASVIDLNTLRNTTNGSYFFLSASITGIQTKVRVQDSGNFLNVNNSYGALSDEKLKENIADASSQWNDIKAIKVRKYSMKEDNLGSANKIGVIAQELETAGLNNLVEEIYEEVRDTNEFLEDGVTPNPNYWAIIGKEETPTKTVKYSILYMKAVKALQEAMTRIETLEAKVTALENG